MYSTRTTVCLALLDEMSASNSEIRLAHVKNEHFLPTIAGASHVKQFAPSPLRTTLGPDSAHGKYGVEVATLTAKTLGGINPPVASNGSEPLSRHNDQPRVYMPCQVHVDAHNLRQKR